MQRGNSTSRGRDRSHKKSGTTRAFFFSYHSPLAVPSPLREASVLPAAAEAKLEGSGVGIMRWIAGRWRKNSEPKAREVSKSSVVVLSVVDERAKEGRDANV